MWTKGIHTLNWHLHQYSVNIWSTSRLTVSWESTNFRRHAMECWSVHIWICWHSANHQPTVNRVSIKCWSKRQSSVNLVPIKYQLRCWSSVSRDNDWVLIESLLMVSINTRSWMPLVHETHANKFNLTLSRWNYYFSCI